jgi:chlorobactene glucosyltransferase
MDPRVRLIVPPALPSGWCGKPFACSRLAAEASGEWLLFIDADARLYEGAIGRMLNEAVARDVSFLSCWPGLELKGLWEKILMPMLNFVVLTLFPAPLSMKRRDASLGLAHGACILARREEYKRVGGHVAVRDELFEDTSLARIWRARGERGLCLDGQKIVRVRMYDSFHGIWNGFRKNFFPSFRHVRSFWLFMLLHLFCFFLPFVLCVALALQGAWSLQAGLAAVSVLLMRALLALRFGYPLWSVLLHPLAECVLLILGIVSWWSCRGGRGVEWKGRIYRAGAKSGVGSGA